MRMRLSEDRGRGFCGTYPGDPIRQVRLYDRYYSADYIRRLFKKYHVHISGAVTGLGCKTADAAKVRKEMETLIGNKYPITIHIDKDMLLRVSSRTKEVDEYEIGGTASEWSQRVMEIIKKIEKHA